MTGVICGYGNSFYQRRIQKCPTCNQKRRMVEWNRVWDDPIITCCGCGDSWAAMEGRMPRPFTRGWRKAAITEARKRYATAGGPAARKAWLKKLIADMAAGMA